MYSSTLGGQFDLKSADELVASTRLNIIEKEHKSFGSLIDNRQLFALDETPKPNKKAAITNEDSTTLASFFKSALNPAEVQRVPDDTTSITNITLNTTNYANEELIWRTKSTDKIYFQKRAFEDPSLQQFKDSLTTEQKKRYRELTVTALHGIADKYRAEMGRVKDEMDSDGVFHPQANAHRVHCIYLLKLYKGISAHTIEDPVLKRLRAEEVAKKDEDAAAEERKQMLIRIATVGREVAEKEAKITERAAAVASLNAPIDNLSLSAKDTSSLNTSQRERSSISSKRASIAQTRKNTPSKRSLDRKQSSILEELQTRKNSEQKGNLERRGSIVRKESIKRGSIDSFDVSSTGGIAGLNSLGGGATRANKDKEDKEYREDADDESEGSSTSASVSQLQSRWNDNSNPDPLINPNLNLHGIPHVDKMMFNKIKQRRLGAADARSLLPEEVSRLENAEIISPKKEKQRSALMNNESTAWILKKLQDNNAFPTQERGGRDTAQPMIPFEEFQKMFDEYTESAAVSRAQTQIGEGARLGAIKIPESSTIIEAELMEEEPEVVNRSAVQLLAKVDPMFDTFLKMSLRERPAGKRLIKSTAPSFLKAKIKRVTAPLGLSAVILDPIPPKSQHQPLSNDNGDPSLMTGSRLDGIGSGGISHYMTATRQSDGRLGRGNGGASGFLNCFNIIDTIDETVYTQPVFEVGDSSINGYKERRILSPGPSPDQGDSMTIEGSPLLPIGKAQGVRSLAAHRRRMEQRERDEAGTPSKGLEMDTMATCMQRKLVQMWDCLQVPASERLDFMRKFSLYPYSMQLGQATDQWAEVAVLVMARQEILKLLGLLKSGFRRMPLKASELIESMIAAVPADLASKSSSFLPLPVPTSSTGGRKNGSADEGLGSPPLMPTLSPLPLSAAALTAIIEHVTKTFQATSLAETPVLTRMPSRRGSRSSRRGSYIDIRKNSVSEPSTPPNEWDRPSGRNSPTPMVRSASKRGLKKFNMGKSRRGSLSRDSSWDDFDTRSEDSESNTVKDDGILLIKGDKEATSCLLQLRKIVDGLLLSALRSTQEAVNDVVTYGKMPVQDWMNMASVQ